MFRDAWLVAAKDLRLELRSRVALNQVVPFAVLVLVLFAFALDPDRVFLAKVTPGLYWIAVLFSALLAVQRAFAIETADGIRDGLRLSGLAPAGIFLGKVIAISIQLVVLEVLLALGVVVLYGAGFGGPLLLVPTALAATLCLASAGSIYGLLSAGLRVKETILPLLLLPILAPVLIAATQAFTAGMGGYSGEGWRWLGLLVLFAAAYLGLGLGVYGVLLEEG